MNGSILQNLLAGMENTTIGDDGDNTLMSAANGNDPFDGDDVLAGAEANDMTNDFAAKDAVDLAGFDVASLADLDLLDSDDGAILMLADGGALTLEGIQAAQLNAQNFVYSDDQDSEFIAGTDGDDFLAGSEGTDTIAGFQADGLLDLGALGLADFDALEIQDSDDGAGVIFTESETGTFEGVEAADLTDMDFLLDT